jgi:STIMATE family
MGIFPIIMNVVQFWLIDSIVKGHGLVSSLALPPDPASSRDQEPLFRGSVSDDGEDGTATLSKIDIQDPRSWTGAQDEESGLLAENATLETKSSSSSTTPLEVERDDVALHRYRHQSPPSVQRSLPSTSQPISSHIPDASPPGKLLVEDSVSDEWAWDEPGPEEWEAKGEDSKAAVVDKQDLARN